MFYNIPHHPNLGYCVECSWNRVSVISGRLLWDCPGLSGVTVWVQLMLRFPNEGNDDVLYVWPDFVSFYQEHPH